MELYHIKATDTSGIGRKFVVNYQGKEESLKHKLQKSGWRKVKIIH